MLISVYFNRIYEQLINLNLIADEKDG